ncbi:MAG TPA: hypothetical protein VGO61_19460 [Steroidobacteraceae bacterium]|nr:hypothetical protein [Steroidobacteraceae bacterium]
MRNSKQLAARILLAAGFAASAVVEAEDFRVQAQLSYDQFNFSGNFAPDADVLSVSGTYFFAPVPTDGVPVGEAAYIARSSFANVMATHVNFADNDFDTLEANVGYHLPNTIFFGRVGVVRADIPGGGDDTSWNGTFGIVPIPRLFFGTDFTEDGYDPNITARYVGQFKNSHWYGASVSAVDPDGGDSEVGVEFDYYFDTFKVGGGFNTAGDRWTVRAEKGLPHGFALLGHVDTDDGGDGFGLTLTWRDL